jgi:hippurate hydrolase
MSPLLFLLVSMAQGATVRALAEKEAPSLEALYKDLHRNPEISYQESATAKRIAAELRAAGFTVAENCGKYPDLQPPRVGHGVVGVLENGAGPTILVRTDLDGLPVEERTGLAYASRAHGAADDGSPVAAMHACGHDMHMSVFVGTARVLAAARDRWHGTLVFVGQPAEERAPGGAEALLRDGLYTKYKRPDACFALHCHAELEAGKMGFVPGFALANADIVDITVRGRGGHGAYPQATKDPVVLAAQIVVSLQTIVSREVPPGEPAVVTVGSIHGGTKHNIIPDEVKLQLTVRSYTKNVREQLLGAIARVAKGAAEAAGFPKDLEPIVDTHPDAFVPATYNDPELIRATVPALRAELGEGNVVEMKPVLGAEDFGRYSLEDHSVPCVMFWLGTIPPARVEEHQQKGAPLPSLHSSAYAPAIEPTIATGVRAMAAAVLSRMR